MGVVKNDACGATPLRGAWPKKFLFSEVASWAAKMMQIVY